MKLLHYLQTKHHLARRVITTLIKQHQILVNNHHITSFGHILHDGDHIQVADMISTYYHNTSHTITTPVLIGFYKPAGYVVSKSDPHNPTIYQLLPTKYHHYYPIGRLDKESTGLLLLSNDPTLVHNLSHPSNNHRKIYHITLDRMMSTNDQQAMLDGIWVDHQGKLTTPQSNTTNKDLLRMDGLQRLQGNDYTCILTAGKNRHIRRMCQALGYNILRLHRVQFGNRKLVGNEGDITVLQ